MRKKIINHIQRNIFRYACVLAMCVILLFTWAAGVNSPAVYAEESKYSDVMVDLRSDPDFNASDYPKAADDRSIDVITVGESVNGELFIYVYNPSEDRTATSINISSGINNNFYPRNYMLECLSKTGVFGKYLVKDFTIKEDALRYYSIPSIFREFDGGVDEGLPDYNENIIDEKSFAVGKLYTASTVDGKVSYTCQATETVEIIDPYVGMLRYSDGFWLWNFPYTDSHYIAFSTDYPIDKLMEADVSYVTRSVTVNYPAIAGAMPTVTYGEPVQAEPLTIYAKDEAGNSANGWFAKEYHWERIQTTEEFIESEELTDEGKQDVENTQWVLRFLETQYDEQYWFQGGSTLYSTSVSQVTILRLKFEVAGTVYNLGAVMDKQTGDHRPDNENTFELDWSNSGGCMDALSTVLMIIALLILLILLWPILPYIIKAVVWVITLPFKAIAALVNAIKKASTKKPKTTASSPTKTVKAPQPKTVYVKSDKPKQSKEKQNK